MTELFSFSRFLLFPLISVPIQWDCNTSPIPPLLKANQQFLLSTRPVFHFSKNMNFFEVFGFCHQLYAVVVYLHGLLPRYIITHVTAKLDDAQDTLARAVKAGAIPNINKYEEDLKSFAGDLALMRRMSNRSPGLFMQVRLAVQHRLTYKLYSLSLKIDAVRRRVELEMDERRLALGAISHNNFITSVSIPLSGVTRPMIHVTLPNPPPPAHVDE
ncbi:hypothetical protein EI94DRAFT_1798403 [Lactarius quietus]|nr:hypothetical protein EI94DRAFT_1798403 [Lactarius quietus]